MQAWPVLFPSDHKKLGPQEQEAASLGRPLLLPPASVACASRLYIVFTAAYLGSESSSTKHSVNVFTEKTPSDALKQNYRHSEGRSSTPSSTIQPPKWLPIFGPPLQLHRCEGTRLAVCCVLATQPTYVRSRSSSLWVAQPGPGRLKQPMSAADWELRHLKIIRASTQPSR
ncbi:hypothetical protein CCUS01_15106 [Colletotrichum cuscutae]|uniref:Uncharacterized protein n=1 Tax=Colletotrichum cuscutae TaxID=1209917 RepID=A0AAI9VEU2_9PEZI|nr:hypothetical protein CCUS01_15106 [Colletotrichum cuscutae]